jgi:HEAT repeat protein
MVRRVFILSAISFVAMTATAPAGLIFNRHPKQNNSSDEAQDPISVLRHDTDERHRLSAVQNLSHSDLKQSPQAGIALIETLTKDPSPAVRTAAADVLGRLHPMAMQIGMALEQAASDDSSSTVRNAAQKSLAAYVHSGYHLSADGAPPLAPAGPPPSKQQPPIFNSTSRPMLPPNPSNEPLAKPIPTVLIPPLSRSIDLPVPPPSNLVPSPPPPLEHELVLPAVPPKMSAIEMSPEPVKPPATTTPSTDKPKDTKPADKGPILNGPG